jgi:predicted transcriptional regulator
LSFHEVSINILKYPKIEPLYAPLCVGGKNRLYEKVHDVNLRRSLRETGEGKTEKRANINSGNTETDTFRTLSSKKLSLDFIAGFFDGEGCITFFVAKASHKKTFPFLMFPRIYMDQRDRDILDIIQKTIGLGTVKPFESKGKIYHSLRINKASEVRKFIEIFDGKLVVKQPHLDVIKKFFVNYAYRKDRTKPRIYNEIMMVDEIRKLNKYVKHTNTIENLLSAINNFKLRRSSNWKKARHFKEILLQSLEKKTQKHQSLQSVAINAGFSGKSVHKKLCTLERENLVFRKKKYGHWEITEQGRNWLKERG